jgi:hypothetical protein
MALRGTGGGLCVREDGNTWQNIFVRISIGLGRPFRGTVQYELVAANTVMRQGTVFNDRNCSIDTGTEY